MKKLLIFFLVIGVLISCNKDMSDQFYPDPTKAINDTTWTTKTISQGFIDTIKNSIGILPTFTIVFPCGSDMLMNLNDSLQVSFPPYTIADPTNNTPYTGGNVQVDVTELRNKGDFIKKLIPTTSTKYLLESAGSFYVSVSRNVNGVVIPATLASNGYVYLKWLDANPRSSMQLFNGAYLTNLDSFFTWKPNTSITGYVTTWDSTNSSINKKGYSLTSKTLGWLNADAFLDTVTTARTRANILMASANFTNKNTLVFMIFKNQRTVVKLSPDYTNRCFYSLNIPVGASVTLLSLSFIDSVLYMGTKDVIVSSANKISLLPQKTTVQNALATINNL